MPWSLCPRRNVFEPPSWLQTSVFRRFLQDFPRKKFSREQAIDVVTRAVAFAYSCAEDDVPKRRVTVFADNSAESQFNVPVLQALLMTLGIDRIIVQCMPVDGTDVADGMLHKSIFYSRRLGNGTYLDLMLSILEWFVQLDEEHPSKALITNHIVQLHEACFNCVGRHKEVLEYMMQDVILAHQPRTGKLFFVGLFDRFLDKLKMQVLDLTIINPLKYIFQNDYKVYENLDNHGRSFWAAVIEDAEIFLPYDDIQAVDSGWAWGAYDFWPVLTEEAEYVFSDSHNLGKGWKELAKPLPPCRSPRKFKCVRSTSLPEFIAETPKREFRPYQKRFFKLLTGDVVLHRFCYFLVQLPEWPEVSQIFGSMQQEDLVNPDTGSTRPRKAQEMLMKCGISIEMS